MDHVFLQFIEYLQTKKYSLNSIQNHRLDLLRFKKWLEGDDDFSLPHLQKLTSEHIQAYAQVLEESVKPRTVARHLSSLRLFFDYLEQQGLISMSPLDLIKFPEIEYTPPEMLPPEEIVALLEAPSLNHYLGLRDRALLELSYSSGLKIKELLNLDIEDLFLDLGFLKVRGKRERMVPVTSKAVEILTSYLDTARLPRLLNKNDACLFPNRNGVRMTRIGFWNMVKKHARRAGIQTNINPRMLRHSFAMHLIQSGMDLTSIKLLFGYVALDATSQYAHVNAPDYFQSFHQFHPRGRHHVDKGIVLPQ
ncbi:MAG: tyrosine-type recombinase/integrase [SAR324 cluster bacterium]|nr:tyrosine-type recombinase/integrase [SAR324 cluster bacterium]